MSFGKPGDSSANMQLVEVEVHWANLISNTLNIDKKFTFNILVFLSDLIVSTMTVNDNTMIGVKQCSMNTAINNLSSQNTFLKELKAFDNW